MLHDGLCDDLEKNIENSMENMGRLFQQYEKQSKGTEKTKLAMLEDYRKGNYFLALGTHMRHICNEIDALVWGCTELK